MCVCVCVRACVRVCACVDISFQNRVYMRSFLFLVMQWCYGTNQIFVTSNLMCVLTLKRNLAIAGTTRAHEMVRENTCLD